MYDAALLMNLFKMLADGKLDLTKFMQMLARIVVQETAASRVGVWFFEGALKDRLVCNTIYDSGDGQWGSGAVLTEDDAHAYFEAIREFHLVVAPDARSHPSTSSFRDGYLEPLNIYSRLDVEINVDAEQAGVVSCEQTGQERDWTQQDMQYLQQAAVTIALALKKFGAVA